MNVSYGLYGLGKLPMLLLVVLGLLAAPSFSPSASAANPPVAAQGWIDVSGHDLGRETVELTGEWELYWGQLLEPDAFTGDEAASSRQAEYANVPHVWGIRKPDSSDNEGAATYRLRIRLGEHASRDSLALYIPGVASAYKLWVDGELKASNGTVGMSRETMRPKNYAKTVFFHPSGPNAEIVVQVSNFVQRKGGMWTPLAIGDAYPITVLRENRMAAELFIASALLVIGLYHVGLWLFRKKHRLAVLLGCASLFFALRTVLLGETLLVRFVPQLDWTAALKLEYMSPNAGVLLFALFVRHLYPKDANRFAISSIVAACSLFCLLIVLTPPRVFTYTMQMQQVVIVTAFLYLLYVYALAILRKRESALLSGLFVLVMFAAALNDILYYNHLVSSIDLAPFGVFVFLFVQTMIVAKRLTGAHAKVEEIGAELKRMNAQLEQTIAERTAELRLTNEHLLAKNDELRQAEESRRQLVSSISHELGTPMTAIQGYVKAIMDGIVEPTDRKHWHTIYDKVLHVNRLVKDLFLLSRLEAKRFQFDFEAMSADELVERQLRKWEWDIRSRGVLFVLDKTTPEQEWIDKYVMVDTVRIDQVVANIVYNALKFTPSGGTITIGCELADGELLVRVTDTGAGIEEQALPYVFDRFYRDGVDSGGQEGTGLGLAIAKEIVLAHGGRIGAESKRNEGSTFYFTLPLATL